MKGRKLVFAAAVVLVFAASCTITKYVPIKETEYITVRDTTVLRDTTIKYKIERERYSDYADLLDTLTLSTDYATSRSYIDTTANKLRGTIESKPEKEVEIQWKEKTVYRDSVVYKEKPYPVEVEKKIKYVPFFTKVLAWVGALSLLLLLLFIIKKVYLKK